MKKLFSKMLVLCALFIAVSAVDAYSTQITIKLTWGKKSKNCRGFGICRFDVSIISDDILRLSDDHSTLMLDVTSADVKGYESYFFGPTITIEEEYEVPAEVQTALGSDKPLYIRPGKYKCEKTSTGYTIYFAQ